MLVFCAEQPVTPDSQCSIPKRVRHALLRRASASFLPDGSRPSFFREPEFARTKNEWTRRRGDRVRLVPAATISPSPGPPSYDG